jgi:hypothetical protein
VANFNQIWHKSSLGGGIQLSSNEGQRPCPRGDNSKTSKDTLKFLKNLLHNHQAKINQTWY